MSRRELEDKFEFKFARDLIAYVLGTHMKGLFWTPTAFFRIRSIEDRIDSPFTPQVRNVVKITLDSRGHRYHEIYDLYCSKPITLDKHREISLMLKNQIFKPYFEVHKFIIRAVILAMFAGLSYLYGVEKAPHVTCRMIFSTVQELKERGTIDDNFWNEMQDCVENRQLWLFRSKKE